MFNKIIILIIGSYCIVPSVYASDIYQCKNNNGEVSFQQQPCKAAESSVKINDSYGRSSSSLKKGGINSQDIDSILKILFQADLNGNMKLNEKRGGAGFTEWIDQLSTFEVTDVISAVEKLWSIELAKPRRNGAYIWTTRAKNTENGEANNVVNISYGKNNIYHFQVYRSATFSDSSVGPFVSWKGSKRKGR